MQVHSVLSNVFLHGLFYLRRHGTIIRECLFVMPIPRAGLPDFQREHLLSYKTSRPLTLKALQEGKKMMSL